MSERRIPPVRLWAGLLLLGVLFPLGYIACAAGGLGRGGAALVAATLAVLAAAGLARRLPADFPDTGRGRRILWAACIAAGLLATLRLAMTATFMLDREETRFVEHQPDDFGIRHNCFTCYLVAAQLAAAGTDNLYDASLYRNPRDKTPVHETIGDAFTVDRYPYPPPFLLLPGLLLATGADFFQIRTWWFVLSVLALGAALWAVALRCGGFRSQHGLLLFPLVLAAPTTHIALQIGNVHLVVFSVAVLGMVAFEKQHEAAGGALLGFAVVTKVWPAILLAYLLAGRRWRAVGWTCGAVAAYSAAALLAFGPAPFRAFFDYQLPRLANGEAFSFMATSARALTANLSLFGVPHKLHRLGLLEGAPALVSPALAWTYRGLLALLVLRLGLRRGKAGRDGGGDAARLGEARVWLALLGLAQLASPFLPWPYGVVSSLWVLLLLVPGARGPKAWILGLGWILLAVNVPLPGNHPRVDLCYTLLGSVVVLGACLAAAAPRLLAGGSRVESAVAAPDRGGHGQEEARR